MREKERCFCSYESRILCCTEGEWESHQRSLRPEVRCSGRSYNHAPLAYSRLPPDGAWTAAEFNA